MSESYIFIDLYPIPGCKHHEELTMSRNVAVTYAAEKDQCQSLYPV